MTSTAGEPSRDVGLVAIRQRLFRRRVRRQVFWHVKPGSDRAISRRRRLSPRGGTKNQKNDQPLHDFFPPTASMDVPRSFSSAAAALRPGYPVIEPPGGVHAPV